ncbi:MAG: hypothetical protein AAFQ22_01460 [Pseudomonadota bacterium]
MGFLAYFGILVILISQSKKYNWDSLLHGIPKLTGSDIALFQYPAGVPDMKSLTVSAANSGPSRRIMTDIVALEADVDDGLEVALKTAREAIDAAMLPIELELENPERDLTETPALRVALRALADQRFTVQRLIATIAFDKASLRAAETELDRTAKVLKTEAAKFKRATDRAKKAAKAITDVTSLISKIVGLI